MTKISANFNREEFACPCCGEVKVSEILVDKLQELRDVINKPIIITSGYRCLQYNKKVGGYSHSPHLTGEAADIKIKGMSTVTIAMIARHISYIRLGLYPNHLHIDIRPANPSKYWLVKKYNGKYIYSGKEKSLAKFLKNNL
jgi:hypothetical protein